MCDYRTICKTFRQGLMKANCQLKAWARNLNKYTIKIFQTSISHLLNQRTLSFVSYLGSTWNHSIQMARFNWLTERLINHEHFSRVRVFFTFYFISISILFHIFYIYLILFWFALFSVLLFYFIYTLFYFISYILIDFIFYFKSYILINL